MFPIEGTGDCEATTSGNELMNYVRIDFTNGFIKNNFIEIENFRKADNIVGFKTKWLY